MAFDLSRRIALLGLIASACPFAPLPARAGTLPSPTGRILLTVEGRIDNTNADGRAELDRAMLEGIGLVEVKTWTPFTEGQSTWRGVRLKDLMTYLGAKGTTIRATALDLYAIELPVSDVIEHDPFIALEQDGKALRVRDKGPAWILYPFARDRSLDNEEIAGRCVWQLATITFQ